MEYWYGTSGRKWSTIGAIPAIHKQKRGKTCICGGTFTTTPHHTMIVHNRIIHQGSQLIGTDNEEPRT